MTQDQEAEILCDVFNSIKDRKHDEVVGKFKLPQVMHYNGFKEIKRFTAEGMYISQKGNMFHHNYFTHKQWIGEIIESIFGAYKYDHIYLQGYFKDPDKTGHHDMHQHIIMISYFQEFKEL